MAKKPRLVNLEKWLDGLRFLMQLGNRFPTLTAGDKRKLMAHMRGPFADGMTEERANRILTEAIGWEREDKSC